MSLLDGFFGLSKDVNKVDDANSQEGVISDLLPELKLEMKDDELIALAKNWINVWEPYKIQIKKLQDDNENYWLGKQFTVDQGDRSLETFLPIATRAKAEPTVDSDNTPEGNSLSDKVRKMLAYLGDKVSFNLKMKQVARYWALYLLGAMKVGWSAVANDVTCKPIRPQKLILDPKATIDSGIYTGYYIGEYVEDTASDLIVRFPNQEKYIKERVKDQMGTTIEYIQWSTNEYVFWSLDDVVLDKTKNPHWNYESIVEIPSSVDEYGQEIPGESQTESGKNHFDSPQMPYIFLSIFNLGMHPFDDTNLIQQNLPLQDLVNKRLSQIDHNADNANGSIAVSGDAFTEEQAKKVARARRKGATLWVPTGDVNAAIKDLPAQPLPDFIYESLLDYRNEIANIYGTRGSTPQGTIKEQTVGGKEIIRGQDQDRIGGGISSYLEQFADRTYNWFVQLMYVYYDEPHSASVVGLEKAKEYITLQNSEFSSKLSIGVKEGSMIPHDPVSQRGEAIELWSQKGIDPITFFERLEFPNPRESAKQLYLWQADPIQLFPDLLQQQQEQQSMQMQQQQQMEQDQQLQDQGNAEEDHNRQMERIQLQQLAKQ